MDIADQHFRSLAEHADEGLAILGPDREFRFVNTAGCRILRTPLSDLVGRPARVFSPGAAGGLDYNSTVRLPGLTGARRIQFSETPISDLVLVSFRDNTDSYDTESKLAAFASTALAVADALDLDKLLSQVAEWVVDATNMVAATTVLVHPDSGQILQAASAGGYPADFAERLEGCRRRGAPLVSGNILSTGRPLIMRDWAVRVLTDPRWAPLHEVLHDRRWGALVAVPMSTQRGVIGALSAFFPLGQDPGQRDVSFLRALAGQAAVAVEHHRLAAEAEQRIAQVERERLARDLHDSVSQSLFALTLQARAVEMALAEAELTPQVRTSLREIRSLTESSHAEMKALVLHLRPESLSEDGLMVSLRRAVAALSARERLPVSIVGPEGRIPLSMETEVAVFRVVSEAVTNVAKHAAATKAHVEIRWRPSDGRLEFDIIDDGRGFDVDGTFPGHLGLHTMRERMEAVGGTLSILSELGVGTTIRGQVPRSSNHTDAPLEGGVRSAR